MPNSFLDSVAGDSAKKTTGGNKFIESATPEQHFYTPEVQSAVENVAVPAPMVASESRGILKKYTDWSSNTGKGIANFFYGDNKTEAELNLSNTSTPLPEKTFFTAFKEIKDEPAKVLPFLQGGNEAAHAIELYNAGKRLEDDTASARDVALMRDYIKRSQQDTSFGYDVASLVTQSIPFMAELGLTGGVYTAGRKAAEKGAEAVLKKFLTEEGQKLLEKRAAKFALKAGAVTVGATAQTAPSMFMNIGASTVEKMTPIYNFTEDEAGQVKTVIEKPGEDFGEALRKSMGESWVETVSERTGGVLNGLGPKIKEGAFRSAFIKALFTGNAGISASKKIQVFNKAMERIGWNGVAGEMLEERIGDVMHGVLKEAGLSDQEWKWPSIKQFSTELVGFAVPGTGFAVAAGAINKGKQMKWEKEAEKVITESGLADDINNALTVHSEEDVKKSIVDQTGVTEEHAQQIIDIARGEKPSDAGGILNADDVAAEVEALAKAVETESRLQSEDSQALADQMEQMKKDIEEAVGAEKKYLETELQAIKDELAKRTDDISKKITEGFQQKKDEKPAKDSKKAGLPYKGPKFEKKAQVMVTPKDGGEAVRVEVVGQRDDGIIAKGQDGTPMLFSHDRFDVAPVEKTVEEKQIEKEVAEVAKNVNKVDGLDVGQQGKVDDLIAAGHKMKDLGVERKPDGTRSTTKLDSLYSKHMDGVLKKQRDENFKKGLVDKDGHKINKEESEPHKNHKRYKVTVGGKEINADLEINPFNHKGMVHIEFRDSEPHPISTSGYKSHYIDGSVDGLSDKEIQEYLQKLANAMEKENAPEWKKYLAEQAKKSKKKGKEAAKEVAKTNEPEEKPKTKEQLAVIERLKGLTAQQLLSELEESGSHPNAEGKAPSRSRGEETYRGEYLDELEERGFEKMLTDLGYSLDPKTIWRNNYTGHEQMLGPYTGEKYTFAEGDLANDFPYFLEHWQPAVGENLIKIAYDKENAAHKAEALARKKAEDKSKREAKKGGKQPEKVAEEDTEDEEDVEDGEMVAVKATDLARSMGITVVDATAPEDKKEKSDEQARVESLLNDYDNGENGIDSFGDLVDETESLEIDELQKTIEAYRQEQEDDKEFGQRGDMDTAEENFIASLRNYISGDNASEEPTITTRAEEIEKQRKFDNFRKRGQEATIDEIIAIAKEDNMTFNDFVKRTDSLYGEGVAVNELLEGAGYYNLKAFYNKMRVEEMVTTEAPRKEKPSKAQIALDELLGGKTAEDVIAELQKAIADPEQTQAWRKEYAKKIKKIRDAQAKAAQPAKKRMVEKDVTNPEVVKLEHSLSETYKNAPNIEDAINTIGRELDQYKMALELKRDAIEGHRLREMVKHARKRGGSKGEIPEEFVVYQKAEDEQGNSIKIKVNSLDELAMDLGYSSSEELRRDYNDNYAPQLEELADLETSVKDGERFIATLPDKIKYPSGIAEGNLRASYDVFLTELDSAVGTDTSAERDSILSLYGTNYTRPNNEDVEAEREGATSKEGATEQPGTPETPTETFIDQQGDIDEKQKNPLAKSIILIAKAHGMNVQEDSWKKIENEPWMPLSMERQGNMLFISHVGEQNGDIMRDPEIAMEIVDGQMIPIWYSNDYVGVREKPIKPNDELIKVWAQNLLDQGFARGIMEANEKSNGRPDIHSDNTGGVPDAGDVLSADDSTPDTSTHGLRTGELADRVDELGAGLSAERTDVIEEKIGKKGRQSINDQVKALLDERGYSTNREDYTADEIGLLKLYSGAGGKESAGAEGKGLLSEFYTPNKVVQKTWELALKHAGNVETAFEPSAGTGRYIMLKPDDISMDGIELDLVSGTVAQIINPESNIQIGDFQSIFYKRDSWPQYDLVIGNPPYGARGGFMKGKGEEEKIDRWEEYFIKRGLDMTKEGGVVAYVVNSSFLQKGGSKGKEAIAKLGKLVAAYRLPEGTFEDTQIGTDIVIFRKETTVGLPSSTRDSIVGDRANLLDKDTYFEYNPANILGETKTRKNRFGKEETYVTGDLSALDKIVVETTVPDEVVQKPKEDPKPAKKPSSKAKTAAKKSPKKNSISQIYAPIEGKKTSNRVLSSSNRQFTQEELDQWKNTATDGSIKGFISESDQQKYNFAGGKWYSDTIYYSGNIVKRLAQLELDKVQMTEAQYEKQKSMLLAIKPAEVDIFDISFDPQDRHILNVKVGESTVLRSFLNYMSRNKPALPYGVYGGDISRVMTGSVARKGTKEIMPQIRDAAKRLFNLYIKERLPEEVQKEIVDNYNDTKNSTVNTRYEQIPVQIQGMSATFKDNKPLELSPTQKRGVAFLVQKRTGVLAWGVGVGKTLGIATATVANMQAGNSKRPLIIVPKSTIEQTWIETFRLAFPNIGLVNLSGFTADVQKKMRAERGEPKDWIKDGEVTFISHEGLLRLGYTKEEIVELTGDLNDALWQEGKTKRGEEEGQGKIDEIMGAALKYAGDINFSELGFDHISVDEVHNHRKVFQGARTEKDADGKEGKKRFATVVGGTPAKRAVHLFLTSQYIQKKYGGNVFLASATPFENHATEVYNILSFVARPKLIEMGIQNINDFFAMFANFVPSEELNQRGEVKTKEVMKSWKNLPALQSLLREYIDRREDPTLIRPERRVMTPILAMSELQEENNVKIQQMLQSEEPASADQIEIDPELEGMVAAGELRPGAYLVAMGYALANSVSPYFVEEFAPKTFTKEELIENSPKIKYAMELIAKLKDKEETKDYGTFLYFGAHGVAQHGMIKDYIVEHLGYKESEVGIINGNTDDDVREDIKEAFNSGEIKILIGGKPTREGIDLQKSGYTTMNLSLGWNPTEPQQVEGRVWRQGNQRNIAPIVYPLVENSGDVVLYQKYEQKGGRINDLFSYIGETFDTDELDPQEKKLALITDPRAKATLEIAFDNARLVNERVGVLTEQRNLETLRSEKEQEERQVNRLDSMLKEEKKAKGSYVTEFSKELSKAKAKVKRITESLEKKRITDIDAEIRKLATAVEDLEAQIRDLNSTYDERRERFTTERLEEIRNRKVIADHIDDFFVTTADLVEYTKEEIAAQKAAKEEEVKKKQAEGGTERYRINENLTTKVIKLLGERETVSKQFIIDATKQQGISGAERDLILRMVAEEGDKVNVKKFADKVRTELLPLTFVSSAEGDPRYESTVLPDELRGPVYNYEERVYNSPIPTSAGRVHFNGEGSQNYFAHTRIEDPADAFTEDGQPDNDTTVRRVIELQSDLFQKGRLEQETMRNKAESLSDAALGKFTKFQDPERVKEVAKLEPYRNTWQDRIIREEVRQAALDGKTKLQFPTGETAMRIEGLGGVDSVVWLRDVEGMDEAGYHPTINTTLRKDELKVGETVFQLNVDNAWVITDVLGDGKFKAVPKKRIEAEQKATNQYSASKVGFDTVINMMNSGKGFQQLAVLKETFDISGTIDKQNPIFKFYEKEVAKYLRNKYGATLVTDAQGVTWFEVDVKPEMAESVEAFRFGSDSFDTPADEAKNILRSYFGEDELRFLFSSDLIGGKASGVFNMNGLGRPFIEVVQKNGKVESSTLYHEAFHAYFNLFVPEEERTKLVAEIKKNKATAPARAMYSKEYKTDEIVAEEWLADDFARWIKDQKQENTNKGFYQRMLDKIRSWIRKTSLAEKVYQDIVNKVRPETEITHEATNRMKIPQMDEVAEGDPFKMDLIRKDINLLNDITAQARDIYLKDKKEFKGADIFQTVADTRRIKKGALDRRFADMLKPYFDLSKDEKLTLNIALTEGDRQTRKWNKSELATYGVTTAAGIGAYYKTREAFEYAHDMLLTKMEQNGVKEEEIDQFRAIRVGYVPHRWEGRFVVKTQELTEEGGWKTVSMQDYKTESKARRAYEELESDDNTRYVLDTLDSVDVDFFTAQHLTPENVISAINRSKVPEEFRQEVVQGIRDLSKEKGFGRYYIRRTNIQGYETENLDKIFADYFSGLAGYVTKMEAAPMYFKALQTIDPRRQKKFYKWLRDSIAYDMGNSPELNGVKQTAFIWMLANDISYLMVNSTQNMTVGVGELSKYMKGAKKIAGAEIALMGAMVSWWTGRITDGEREAVEFLLQNGRLGGEMTSELMGFKSNPIYRTMSNTLTKALYSSTAFVESHINRVPAFIAARRVLLANGVDPLTVDRKALEISDDIHFRYGKQNRPRLERGRAGALFVFTHWTRSFLYQLSRDLSQREFMAFGKKMFFTAVLGGTMSLPFAKLWLRIYHEIVGEDPDLKKELSTWELALKKGIPAVYGADLSGRVSVDIFQFDAILSDPTNITKWGGAGASMIDRFSRGYNLAMQERYYEAAAKLVPDGLGGNIFKAYSGYTYGVRSQAGKLLERSPGVPMKYTPWEAALRGIGFTPTEENLAWERRGKFLDQQAQKSADSSVVRRKIETRILGGDTAGARDLEAKAKEAGTLGDTSTPVEDYIEKPALMKYAGRAHAGESVQLMKKAFIAEVYAGEKLSSQKKAAIDKKFDSYAMFGPDNELVTALLGGKTNENRVEVLLQARKDMGSTEFAIFFGKAKRTKLISDDLAKLYRKEQAKALNQ